MRIVHRPPQPHPLHVCSSGNKQQLVSKSSLGYINGSPDNIGTLSIAHSIILGVNCLMQQNQSKQCLKVKHGCATRQEQDATQTAVEYPNHPKRNHPQDQRASEHSAEFLGVGHDERNREQHAASNDDVQQAAAAVCCLSLALLMMRAPPWPHPNPAGLAATGSTGGDRSLVGALAA